MKDQVNIKGSRLVAKDQKVKDHVVKGQIMKDQAVNDQVDSEG